MIISKLFKLYKPEGKDPNYLYLLSEDDVDWYDFRDSLKDSENNIFLALTPDNDIRSVTNTATLLWPENLKLATIEQSKLPEGLKFSAPNSFLGEWVYDEESDRIVPYQPPHDVLVQQAKQKKDELLDETSNEIDILMDINDPTLNDNITDDDRQALVNWKKYRMEIYKIDPNDAPNITWPEKPK